MAGAEPRRGRGSSGIRSRGGVARFNGHGVFGWFLGMPSLVLSSWEASGWRGERGGGDLGSCATSMWFTAALVVTST